MDQLDPTSDAKSAAREDRVEDPLSGKTSKLDRENYPDLTDRQFAILQKGKLPGEIKLHVVVLLISVFALLFSLSSLIVSSIS